MKNKRLEYDTGILNSATILVTIRAGKLKPERCKKKNSGVAIHLFSSRKYIIICWKQPAFPPVFKPLLKYLNIVKKT